MLPPGENWRCLMKSSYSLRTQVGTFRILPKKGRGCLLSVHLDNGMGQDLGFYPGPEEACGAVSTQSSGFAPWDILKSIEEGVGNLQDWKERD